MTKEHLGYHFPNALRGTEYEYGLKYGECIEYIREGSDPQDAIAIAFGVMPERWYEWKKWYMEDVNKGVTAKESRLIDLINGVMKADLKTKHSLEKKALELIEDDDNTDLLKFMLERRFGYVKKQKSDVEVSTDEDFNFNINVVSAKKEEK